LCRGVASGSRGGPDQVGQLKFVYKDRQPVQAETNYESEKIGDWFAEDLLRETDTNQNKDDVKNDPADIVADPKEPGKLYRRPEALRISGMGLYINHNESSDERPGEKPEKLARIIASGEALEKCLFHLVAF
jgi:hypothetical protein